MHNWALFWGHAAALVASIPGVTLPLKALVGVAPTIGTLVTLISLFPWMWVALVRMSLDTGITLTFGSVVAMGTWIDDKVVDGCMLSWSMVEGGGEVLLQVKETAYSALNSQGTGNEGVTAETHETVHTGLVGLGAQIIAGIMRATTYVRAHR